MIARDRLHGRTATSESFATSDLLRSMLENSFGATTVNASFMTNAIVRDQDAFKRGYFNNRINANDGIAFQPLTVKRIKRVYEIALGDNSSVDATRVVGGAIRAFDDRGLLVGVFARASAELRVSTELSAEAISFVLHLVETIALVCEKKATVFRDDVIIELDRQLGGHPYIVGLRDNSKDWKAYGMLIHRDHLSVGYPFLFAEAEHRIDIVNAHGWTWTQTYKDAIRDSLTHQGLHVRVAFLKPHGKCLEAYARMIKSDKEKVRTHIEESVRLWRDLHAEAAEETMHTASLTLYYGKWLPTKALYRFDHNIIVTPMSNVRRHMLDYAFQFTQGVLAGGLVDAYAGYEREMEYVFAESNEFYQG